MWQNRRAKPKSKSTRSKKITKLDNVFSEFIRKRDCTPYGRCISCGKVITYDTADCGHYINRKHMATRYDENNCNAQCRHCLTPDALILMDDFTWKPLGSLSIGDKLLSFDEHTHERKTCRRYNVGTVKYLNRELADIYEVELMNGDKIKTTRDHKWLARRGKTSGYQWIKTEDLWVHSVNLKGRRISGPFREDVSSTVCKPFRVITQDMSYESGWLSGMLDADGHVTQQVARDRRSKNIGWGLRVGISQSETYPDICAKIEELLVKFSDNRITCRQDIKMKGTFRSNVACFSYLITGTNVEKIEFLQRIRPNKLSKIDINKLGKMRSQYDTQVKSIEHKGVEEIIIMETDSHTFISNGYAMHNCNRFDEGNLQGYRRGLIKKYGEKITDNLEIKKHNISKLSEAELDILIAYYKTKIKEL